jgi:hypothetical protein
MGDATQWAAQYYDPGRQAFVDGGWQSMDEAIQFSNVSPGGYVAVLLYNGTTTPWIYSSYFPAGKPQDGETWRFWLYLHGQSGDLELVAAPVTGWLQVAVGALSVARQITYVGWLQVAAGALNIARAPLPGPVAGWINVAIRSLSINRPTKPAPQKEGAAVPWGWIALGSAGLVALAALTPKKPKTKKST